MSYVLNDQLMRRFTAETGRHQCPDTVPGKTAGGVHNRVETTTTALLKRLQTGDNSAMNNVVPLVYDELKKLARSHLRREFRPASLETTGLVHEAYLKLASGRHPEYEDRRHFFGIASRLMRQILVDYARARHARKRGAEIEVAVTHLPEVGANQEMPLLALEDALRQLERADARKAQLIEMRYFGGMTAEECSEALSTPVHNVRRELRLAQAWLRKEMTAGGKSRMN